MFCLVGNAVPSFFLYSGALQKDSLTGNHLGQEVGLSSDCKIAKGSNDFGLSVDRCQTQVPGKIGW